MNTPSTRVIDTRDSPYTIRPMPGVIIFDFQQVDSILDHGDRTFTISADLPTDDLIRIAFVAGFRAGARDAQESQR